MSMNKHKPWMLHEPRWLISAVLQWAVVQFLTWLSVTWLYELSLLCDEHGMTTGLLQCQMSREILSTVRKWWRQLQIHRGNGRDFNHKFHIWLKRFEMQMMILWQYRPGHIWGTSRTFGYIISVYLHLCSIVIWQRPLQDIICNSWKKILTGQVCSLYHSPDCRHRTNNVNIDS